LNSSDIKPVDRAVWFALQQMVYISADDDSLLEELQHLIIAILNFHLGLLSCRNKNEKFSSRVLIILQSYKIGMVQTASASRWL